ncbi:MAG: hypothetical protein R2852_08555 [Bacteroidia bacterium]
MKRSKFLVICLFLLLFSSKLNGQDFYIEEVEEPIEETEQYDYEENAYTKNKFEKGAQNEHNQKPFQQKFDQSHWKTLVKDKTFSEEKIKKEKKKEAPKKSNNNSFKFPTGFKYLWLIPVVLLLILAIYKLVPYYKERNLKIKKKLIIKTDDLDIDEIKNLEIQSPLEQALKLGDYRLAYRLKYLGVLKELIDRNLIYYKKEKTNYEYLIQLSGKSVYEPFRQLTFSFDGIWYGDLPIDESKFHALEPHFTDFYKNSKEN